MPWAQGPAICSRCVRTRAMAHGYARGDGRFRVILVVGAVLSGVSLFGHAQSRLPLPVD